MYCLSAEWIKLCDQRHRDGQLEDTLWYSEKIGGDLIYIQFQTESYLTEQIGFERLQDGSRCRNPEGVAQR